MNKHSHGNPGMDSADWKAEPEWKNLACECYNFSEPLGFVTASSWSSRDSRGYLSIFYRFLSLNFGLCSSQAIHHYLQAEFGILRQVRQATSSYVKLQALPVSELLTALES